VYGPEQSEDRDVIRTMFECPATGEPLRSTMIVGGWPAREDESVSAHCPKCGELHRFHAEDAILLMDGDATVPLRLVAPA
jgi:predicted RNA-binding Zn-ribbon protein involved in translation (DUF1610 family)